MTWTGLWLVLSRVEFAFGKIWTALVLLLPGVAANASFLLVSQWHEAELSGSAAGWQIELLNFFRLEREFNTLPWRPVPLWLGIGIFAMFRIPRVRVASGAVPIGCLVVGLAALEFTVMQSRHGQFYAWDMFVATIFVSLILAGISRIWQSWTSGRRDCDRVVGRSSPRTGVAGWMPGPDCVLGIGVVARRKSAQSN